MRFLLALACASVVTVAAPARAEDRSEPLELRWTAPRGCPSGDAVRAASLRNVGRDARRGELRAPLEAEAHVEQRGNGWTVRLRTRRGDVRGEREIEAATCAGVADATALVLALALVPPVAGAAPADASSVAASGAAPPAAPDAPDARSPASALERDAPGGPGREGHALVASAVADAPRAATEAPDGRDPPTAPSPAPASGSIVGDAAARPLDRDRPAPPQAARGAHAFAVGASMAGDLSTLPAPAIGGALTVGWTPGRFRIEVDARRWAAQSRTVEASFAGARFTMTSLGGRGAWTALRRGPLDLAASVGADVHLVTATGFGADANFDRSGAWTAVAGGALARLAIASWLALRARVEAFVPLTRPTFLVENEGAVHRPPTFGAAGTFGAEALFF